MGLGKQLQEINCKSNREELGWEEIKDMADANEIESGWRRFKSGNKSP